MAYREASPHLFRDFKTTPPAHPGTESCNTPRIPSDTLTWKYEDYYRIISSNVCIRSNEEWLSQKFKRLYAYYYSETPLQNSEVFSLVTGAAIGTPPFYTLFASGKAIFQTDKPGEVLPYLEWFLLDALIPKLTPYLKFHAAVLSMNGRGVIFPANSGFGKTTLSFALLMHGFKYLSDEIVVMNPDTFSVLPLPRGLVIREEGFRLLRSLGKPVPPVDFYVRSSNKDFWYFNPVDYVHLPADGEVFADAIVFLEKPESSRRKRLEKMSKAEAVARLLSNSLDADSLAEKTVSRITELAHRTPCYSLSEHTLQGRVDCVRELMGVHIN